jgi:ubiquinol-cytochrome c reductase iron-sulfur subunit
MSRSDGAPRGVVVSFFLTMLCAAGFATSYVLDLSTEVLGATIGGAFLFLAVGLALWSRRIGAAEPEYVEERAVGPTPPAEYDAFREALTDQPVPRSGVLWGMLGLALASVGGAALFPLRSLFPKSDANPDQLLTVTEWKDGLLLVTEDGERVRPEDLDVNSIMTVFPVGVDHKKDVDTTTVIVKLDPSELELPPERENWAVDGIVAYSKLCTHAGCPVGLYADTYRQLLCPCHHSIFDVRRAAAPVEGPAARPLPQLPLGVDEDGYLIARGDFSAPVAAGWWRYPEA